MAAIKTGSRLLVIAEYLFNQVRDMSDAELTAFYKQCKRVKSNNCEEIIYTASLSMLPFAEEEVLDRKVWKAHKAAGRVFGTRD